MSEHGERGWPQEETERIYYSHLNPRSLSVFYGG